MYSSVHINESKVIKAKHFVDFLGRYLSDLKYRQTQYQFLHPQASSLFNQLQFIFDREQRSKVLKEAFFVVVLVLLSVETCSKSNKNCAR